MQASTTRVPAWYLPYWPWRLLNHVGAKFMSSTTYVCTFVYNALLAFLKDFHFCGINIFVKVLQYRRKSTILWKTLIIIRQYQLKTFFCRRKVFCQQSWRRKRLLFRSSWSNYHRIFYVKKLAFLTLKCLFSKCIWFEWSVARVKLQYLKKKTLNQKLHFIHGLLIDKVPSKLQRCSSKAAKKLLQ